MSGAPAVRRSLQIAAIAGVFMFLSFDTGVRIGEAANPGPAPEFPAMVSVDAYVNGLDDPEGDPFAELDCHLEDVAVDCPGDDAWMGEGDVHGPGDAWSDGHHSSLHGHGGTAGLHEAAPSFSAASKFAGPRPDMVFKLGDQGLGYYKDSPSVLEHPLTGGIALPSRWAVPLSLEALLVLPRRPRRQPRAVARKRRPRRGRRAPGAAVIIPEGEAVAGDASFRRTGLWAFDTLNSNVASTAQAYLERTAADACLFQELRLRPSGCEQAERTAARGKWSLSIEPAVDTEAGSTSAGVGVAVRSHFGLALPRQAVEDDAMRSRVQVRWMGAVCRGGLHLVSVYLWHTEGLSQRNLDLLQCLAGVLRQLRGPWIVGGDFNLTPDMLRTSGWLFLVNGVLHSPGVATCKGRQIDFFVTSAALAPAVAAVLVVGDTGSGPHSAVRMLLKAAPRGLKVRCLAAPRKFPAFLPAGCLPSPPCYNDVIEMRSAATGHNLDQSYLRWLRRVEHELADVSCLDAAERRRACCRAGGPRFVWKPALGPVGSPTPKVSRVTTAWRTVEVWLGQLQHGLGSSGPLQRALSHAASRARFRLLATPWDSLGGSVEARELREWVARLTAAILRDRVAVASLRAAARSTAEQHAAADQRRATASWLSWLQEGPSAGLARQHRMSRVASGWIPASVAPVPAETESEEDTGSIPFEEDYLGNEAMAETLDEPLNGQHSVDSEAAKWSEEWQVGQSPPLLVWPAALGEPLPVPCVDAAMAACKTFPAGTGLGWDRLHPRALLRCSREAITALLRLFILAELLGEWPTAIGVVIIALLPKPDGGRRPIGLFPSLVRLWMRIRLPVAQAWQRDHERPYFYAGPAKGADVAAWKQAARAELSSTLPLDYAIVLLDLVKAFERVPHDWLVRQAHRHGYNLFLLRLSIAAYRLARAVGINGVYAALVFATRGITAGAGHATVELRVLLMEWLDEATALCPVVTLTVYVDDIAAEATASESRVLSSLVEVVRCIVASFVMMRLTFSPTKNVCCASRPRLGLALVKSLPDLAIRYRHRVVSLGSGLGAGRRRNAQVASARLTKFVQRRGRFRWLRRSGVRTDRLLRTGGVSALQFGQAVIGVSPATLLRQRRAVAASTVRSSGGGDLDITLMLADGSLRGRADPAFAAHTDPIGHWATAVWEAWLPGGALRRLAAFAARRIAAARRPWSVVRGPAAAFVASARRLGWTVHDAFEVSTDVGVVLRFSLDSPAFVKHAVEESVRRWRWGAIEARLDSLDSGGRGVGAVMQPIYRLLDPRKSNTEADWGPKECGGLRSALANRQWPQARLFRAGLAETPQCRLCLAAAQAAVDEPLDEHVLRTLPHGTLAHRHWSCAVTEPLREELVPRPLLKHAREHLAAGTLDTAKWLRALIPVPYAQVPGAPPEATFHWVEQPPDGVFRGVAYTDGSLFDGPSQHCGLCCRLGWAFVVVDDEGLVVAAAHGVPPPWVTSIHGAELWALQMAVLHAMPGTSFRTDCLSILQVFERGRQWATAGGRYYARIWNVIFACLDDPGEVDLVWMPAHTKADDVGVLLLSNGVALSATDRMGNGEADRLAKDAAEAVRVPPAVRAHIAGASALAKQLAKWIGQVTAAASSFRCSAGRVMRDSLPGPRVPRPPRPARARAQVQQRPAERGGHLLERHGAGWWCAACRATSASRDSLAPGMCSGPALQRWARQAASAHGCIEHRIRETGKVVWCDRCGAYATTRGRGIARACLGRPADSSAAARLAALRAGRHPVTGVALVDDVVVATVHEGLVQSAIAAGQARWAGLLARVRARERG